MSRIGVCLAAAGALVLLGLAAGGALGLEQRFPAPEFRSGYQLPPPPGAPVPRPELFLWVDAAVLLLTLGLAAYLALRVRSRRHLFVLTLFALGYFGFYRRGCVCSIGAIQNVAQSLADPAYALPLLVGVFFVLPLLFALFFGRVFCAAVCPLGAAQEVVLLRPLRVPRWLDSALGVVPWAYLGLGVLLAVMGVGYLFCRQDPFVSFFRLGGSVGLLIWGAAVLLLAVVVGRPYCRWLCPYGALLRLFSPVARWQVRLHQEDCLECHLCADACPYGAILPPTPPRTGGRREGLARLGLLLGLLPVLIAAGGMLGWLGSDRLAQTHPQVRLATRVALEQQGLVEGTTEASEAFYELGDEPLELYQEATAVLDRFAIGAPVLGGWLGLVVGLRLIGLSVRRRRKGYQIDQAACLACARCYAACPLEHNKSAQETQPVEGKQS